MKHIVLISILSFAMFAQAETAPELSGLDSLLWKNRIIVIKETQDVNKPLQLLEQQTAEINDRDIIWFIIKNNISISKNS